MTWMEFVKKVDADLRNAGIDPQKPNVIIRYMDFETDHASELDVTIDTVIGPPTHYEVSIL